MSREFFHKRTAEDAFKVIQVELNFIYEVLYTKVVVVHSKLGYFFRLLASGTVIVALVLFTRLKKHGYHRFDVWVTYCMLYGAIALDAIALFMLVFSDWRFATKKNSDILNKLFRKKYVSFITCMHKPSTCQIKREDNIEVLNTPILSRRWSETIYSYNFLSVCLEVRQTRFQKPKDYCGAIFGKIFGFFLDKFYQIVLCMRALTKAAEFFGLEDSLASLKYVSRNPFPTKLWEFMFDELQVKSMFAEDTEEARKIYEARGNWVLQDSEWKSDCKAIMKYVEGVEYDRSLLLWHIATELCYNTDDNKNNPNFDREFSKILSDYMLYLLIKQPTIMSNVTGIGEIRFRDTCAEAKKFFERRGTEKENINILKDACQNIIEVETSAKGTEPIHEKGDRSKSVLFDGCILAKELGKRGQEKWKIMCRVWVELLCYAASHCRAETHAQVLSKGGELVTFVWLLMAHLGIGEQFQINEGHARAKLSVGG